MRAQHRLRFLQVIMKQTPVQPNPMYLVILPTEGRCPHLLFWSDPRPHCPHPVVEGVDFIDLPPRDDHWKWGGEIPLDDMQEPILARSRRQPKKFRAFKSELDVPIAWDILDGPAEVWSTWEAFQRSVT